MLRINQWVYSSRQFNTIRHKCSHLVLRVSRCLNIQGSPRCSLIVPPLPGSQPSSPSPSFMKDQKKRGPKDQSTSTMATASCVGRYPSLPFSQCPFLYGVRHKRSHSAWLSLAMHFRTFPGAGADLFENQFAFFCTCIFRRLLESETPYNVTDCRCDSL